VDERLDGTNPASARVATRVLADVDALIARLGAAYRRQVPEYAALSEMEMDTEVLPASRSIVEVFFQSAAAGVEPDMATVADFERMGRRRLEMGVPLEPVLHVFRVAARETWAAIVAATDAGDEVALADLGGRWMDYMDQASSLVAAAYMEASHDRLRHVEARRSAMFGAILTVADEVEAAAVTATFGVRVAAAYLPVVVGSRTATVTAEQLVRVLPEGAIAGYRDTAVALLVPAPSFDHSPLDIARTTSRLQAAAPDSTIVTADVTRPGPALALAVGRAERLLGVALALGSVGVVGPDELLAERLLAEATDVIAALRRRVLDPLRAGDRTGAIEATLRLWLEHGSVPATARAAIVHDNTVAYRLRRVLDLCGLDPRRPVDATLLSLALTADLVDPTTRRPKDSGDRA
jgi:hypothetical protein